MWNCEPIKIVNFKSLEGSDASRDGVAWASSLASTLRMTVGLKDRDSHSSPIICTSDSAREGGTLRDLIEIIRGLFRVH